MGKIALLLLVAAALVVPTAAAEAPAVRVAGGGSATIGAGGVVVTDHFQVGAVSGPLGDNPRGHITIRGTILPGGSDEQIFHGDVRHGCVRVIGNRAVVVGRLPEREWFEVGSGTIKWAALVLEDNGEPVSGQPVDRGVDFVLTDFWAEIFCTTLDPAGEPFFPLDQGNFVIDSGAAPTLASES
jgi:hypothetical protein